MESLNELARVTATVAAPAAALWTVLSDFERPQLLVTSIKGCIVTGSGIGAVRIVESARGPTIHERLLICDSDNFRFQYEVLETGDMVFKRVKRYRSTILLTPFGGSRTKVDWLAEGRVDGDTAPVRHFLDALYRGAIASLAMHAMTGARA
jgi:hypothetical protein